MMASSLSDIPEPVCTSTTDSQCLAELSTMFPNIEYDVLVSVLQANNGRIDTTVEYFITNSNLVNVSEHSTHTPYTDGDDLQDQEDDMIIGQFSEDIGGLPEMLPSFIFDAQDTEFVSDEDSSVTHSRSPSPDSNVNSDDDPLPTYEQACTDQDRLPEAVYIEDELENVVTEVENSTVQEVVPVTTSTVQNKKYKKVRKLAGKLKDKKFRIKLAKGKRKSEHSISAREGYTALDLDQEIPDAGDEST